MYRELSPEQIAVLRTITAKTKLGSVQLLAIRSAIEALPKQLPAPRIEDQVQMFHARYVGIVTGRVGEELTCAECGQKMTSYSVHPKTKHGSKSPGKSAKNLNAWHAANEVGRRPRNRKES